MRHLRKSVCLIAVAGFLAGTMISTAYGEWPEGKSITAVIQYGAGGGTDVMTRAYTKLMEKSLGTTINAVNQPGAIGALAMDSVNSKPADGYWWLGGSQFNKGLRVMGHTKLSPWKDWQYFKVADGIQAWSVPVDSPFKTMEDFLAAARKDPDKYKISNSGIGGIWHEGNEILSSEAKIKIRHIPYKGGAPAVMACLQGEVDVAGSGVHEAIEFIRAGKLRNLAVFTREPIKLKDGTILKPISQVVPSMAPHSPFGSEYTLAVKRETPVAVLEKVQKALVDAANSPEFEDIMEKKFFFKSIVVGREADRLAALRESVTAWLFWDLKVQEAKTNPADLGIPRPQDFEKWWPPKDYAPRMK